MAHATKAVHKHPLLSAPALRPSEFQMELAVPKARYPRQRSKFVVFPECTAGHWHV